MTAATVRGIDAVPVSVEVDVSPGLPGVTMVGLPDTTVRESRDRVRTAIRNSGFPFPGGRVTVSLAPADLKKAGAAFDLPIALGILAAAGLLPHRDPTSFPIVGGLSLDGSVPPVRGLLPIAIAARRSAGQALMFPADNLAEAGIVPDIKLFAVASLVEAARVLCDADRRPHQPLPRAAGAVTEDEDDLADVRGQAVARRAIEVAAAGAHHVLMSGPPGAGKTMLARRLPALLPPPSFDEALTITSIHSVAGLLGEGHDLVRRRPFRAPHHSCSDIALVGGGTYPRPGELSLAHGGVLFLDEMPEFSRRVLESLRQPLELGEVHIARASRSVTFPADVMLVGAMNPCPCGHADTAERRCRCTPGVIARYQQRLSGPLRDRFDVAVALQPVPWRELRRTESAESSDAVRQRVCAARARQLVRQGVPNGRLGAAQLREYIRPASTATQTVLEKGVRRLGLTARAVARLWRVARTVADLDGSPRIEAAHVAEALQFRLPLHTPVEDVGRGTATFVV